MPDLDFFRPLIKYAELSAGLSGLLYWQKIRGSIFRVFPFFLLLLFAFECLGAYFHHSGAMNLNINLYKFIVIPYIYLSLQYFFYKIFERQLNKRISLLLMLIFIAGWLYELIFIRGTYYTFNSLAISVGNITLFLSGLMFFYNYMLSKDILHFNSDYRFYFTLAVLIYYLGTFPYWALYNNLLTKEYYNSIFIPYSYFMVMLNFVMYFIFAFGFVWMKKRS